MPCFEGWSVSTIKRAPDGSTWINRRRLRREAGCREVAGRHAPVLMREFGADLIHRSIVSRALHRQTW
jgi:hypothetical protein